MAINLQALIDLRRRQAEYRRQWRLTHPTNPATPPDPDEYIAPMPWPPGSTSRSGDNALQEELADTRKYLNGRRTGVVHPHA